MPIRSCVPGSPRSAVPTPALILDLDGLERNIAAMATQSSQWAPPPVTPGAAHAFPPRNLRLRPHAKSHKCLEIARLQMAAGALGIACATLEEVATMIEGGIGGLLLTSPVAGEARLGQLAGLLRRDPSLLTVADDPGAVDELERLAHDLSIWLSVLVDVDVGQHRTGCRTPQSVLALAHRIHGSPHLDFAGLQAYAGHLQHVEQPGARQSAVQAVASQVRDLCQALASEQMPARIVTGAGTGSAGIDGPGGVYTELQPGSYVFMDAEYLAVEGLAGPFQPSLFVDTTVVSSHWDDHVTTDAGTKAFALNGPPPRPAIPEAGWSYRYDGDEFGRLILAPGARRPARGERLSFIVSHCDPTVVLYPYYVCVRKDRVEACWPITPRS